VGPEIKLHRQSAAEPQSGGNPIGDRLECVVDGQELSAVGLDDTILILGADREGKIPTADAKTTAYLPHFPMPSWHVGYHFSNPWTCRPEKFSANPLAT
jgi:hypothetical protein